MLAFLFSSLVLLLISNSLIIIFKKFSSDQRTFPDRGSKFIDLQRLKRLTFTTAWPVGLQ